MWVLLPFLPVHASLRGLSQLAQGCTCQVKLISLESQEFSNSFWQELKTSIPLQGHCIHEMNKISELFRLFFLLVCQTDLLAGRTGHLSCTSSTATAVFQGTLGMLLETPFCVLFLLCRQHFQASQLKESSSLCYHCLVECKHCSISCWGRTRNKYGKNKSNIVNRNWV